MAEIYGHFLANEINATDRDVMGPIEQGQIMSVLLIFSLVFLMLRIVFN